MPEREVYIPLPIPPDAARDARVAARRAADARRAGVALDRLLVDTSFRAATEVAMAAAYRNGWSDGYAASEEHHNGHYGVSGEPFYSAAAGDAGDLNGDTDGGDSYARAKTRSVVAPGQSHHNAHYVCREDMCPLPICGCSECAVTLVVRHPGHPAGDL